MNSAFSMSTLVSYEPLAESTLISFLKQTERLHESPDQACNLARWFQFFAFDVLGGLTWSKELSFVENNRRPEIFRMSTSIGQKGMKALTFQFGGGSRTCIGKNTSLLEIYKLVLNLQRRFDVGAFLQLNSFSKKPNGFADQTRGAG
jgi:hypothetical protein